MMMSPGLRKFALTTHVTSSVGWLGSVAAFVALAIAGISSEDSQIVRAAYLAMHLTTWFVIVPFSFASFLTGLIESLGTPWGCSATIGWLRSSCSPFWRRAFSFSLVLGPKHISRPKELALPTTSSSFSTRSRAGPITS